MAVLELLFLFFVLVLYWYVLLMYDATFCDRLLRGCVVCIVAVVAVVAVDDSD
jgi:hypothetical protein